MNKAVSMEKGISDIVGVFTDPILVFPPAYPDLIPDWLRQAITLERLEMNMRALKGEEMTGTDAEACTYLMTASFAFPFDHDWTQIYLYIAGKTYTRWEKNEIPEDILVESLDADQVRDLDRLKAWIYDRRIKVRLERDRAERRERKQEEAAARKAAQPALFDF